MSNAIETHDLCKKFRRVEALSCLNLEIPEGAVYALVGPSGAGKTTALKTMMNIISPTRGRAEILGMDSTRLAGKSFTRIGYVSENQEMPEWMSVRYFFDYLRPFYPDWDRSLEKTLMRQFELPPDFKLHQLSRGMRMKAALAGSLCYHPRLILLDEPFTGLDPLVRDELIVTLLDRVPESTILVSSHDLAELESIASHVGYLEQGRLRFSDEMSSLSERFREVLVNLDARPRIRAELPAGWMHLAASGSTVQFIDSAFDRERTAADIGQVFGEVRNVTFTPMSLREIFLAMARSDRPIVMQEERI